MYHLLRRKIILITAGCLLSTLSFAQFGKGVMYREDHDDKPYYFGLTLGYGHTFLSHNKTTRFLDDDSVFSASPGFSPSFNLGLLATLHPAYHWEFRANPQLMLGLNRNFKYRLNPDKYLPGEAQYVTKSIQSTIVSFPFSVKFLSDRIQNFRAYMLAGAQFDIDLASNSQARNADDMIKLKQYDYGVHCGIGFNFFLPFVTVSPELKFVTGLPNLHSRSPNLKYSSVLDQLQSRMIVFSIHLEE